ncbi:GON-4-like protein isoform X2 [Solea solea]|uniref:GON-4-like protein isoform X2 n=1 Tax=Solea solea TaxID=90069 RepID=UPI00272D3A86|nr:GON-4-like protein isoform X2 [Solea solea]
MNPARKRLKLSPSSPNPAPSSTCSQGAPASSSHLLSHHALLRGEAEDEEKEEEGYLLVEEDTTDSSLIITMEDSQLEVKTARRRTVRRRRRRGKLMGEEEDEQVGGASESDEKEEVEIDRQLDQSLATKSKQHNLTTVNVKNIIHEVITNEHVVAMMKAAINETEAVPAFEPKMTRSKFKEVVEKGVVIPAWNISPIKKTSDVNKPPQFVDIPLAEEDSSDEEYRPDEEDDDETAEDTFQESDMESTASSPRGSRLSRGDEDSCSPWQTSHSRSRTLKGRSVSMGPPPPPKALPPKAVTDSTFLEKLHAVEEELAVCMEPYQPLSESEDEVGLMAYRTRSKRPLRDIPLGRLEAELQAPDITPDMYDSSSALEDRDWTDWLRGLMTTDVDNEEEGDDDDDPEYNFLADVDEPDLEDYRDDKAVRITKKEVNQLMEELFETLKEDLTGQEVDDEGHEEEEETQEDKNSHETQHTSQEHNTALSDSEEHEPITELRTVKQKLSWIRKRRHTHALCDTHTPEPHTLKLDATQKRHLQQQLQQHVQLLTQIHLLTSPVSKLQSEAETTRQFLVELDVLALRTELLMSSLCPGFCSSFRSSNLQGALQLLEELRLSPISYQTRLHPPDARGHMRVHPVMPPELAWIFSTRPVFLYPELLPCASLDPALYCPRRTAAFTAAEDCLLVLGLRNMDKSCDPPKLVSQFLLRKTLVQVRRRILQCCRPGVPDNIVKVFRYQRVLWTMPVACRPLSPGERRPPVEREDSIMPMWLVRSLPVIYPTIKRYNAPPGSTPEAPPTCKLTRPRQSHYTFLRSASSYSFPPGTKYPPRLPKHFDFKRIGFVVLQQPLPPPSTDSSALVSGGDIIITSTISLATTEQIKSHYQTLVGLRRKHKLSVNGGGTRSATETLAPPPPPEGSPSSQLVEEDDDISTNEEEGEEEESEVLLALSESSSSTDDDHLSDREEVASEREEGGATSRSDVQLQEKLSSGGSEEEEPEVEEEPEEDDQRHSDDEAFARDYLHRVCEAVEACPGVAQQLLQVLDQVSAGAVGADLVYDRLRRLLHPWPQLLRDFAAFLNREQAQSCGLLMEQQLFESSRRFLRQLGQILGKSSSLYQQVVSLLQESPTLSPTDMEKISSLLKLHPHLHQLFQQLHPASLPAATEGDSVSQNPLDKNRKRVGHWAPEESKTGSGREEEEEPNENAVVWTREADRAILTACQQRGANRETFTQVSAHLGNRTAQQVSLRFHDLMSLFQKSTSCSSEGQQPIS